MNLISQGSFDNIAKAMEALISGKIDDGSVTDTLILAGSELKLFHFNGEGWVGNIFMAKDLYLFKPVEGLLFLIRLSEGFVPFNEVDKDDFPEHYLLSFEPPSLAYNCTVKIGRFVIGENTGALEYIFTHNRPNNRSINAFSHLATLIFAPPVDR